MPSSTLRQFSPSASQTSANPLAQLDNPSTNLHCELGGTQRPPSSFGISFVVGITKPPRCLSHQAEVTLCKALSFLLWPLSPVSASLQALPKLNHRSASKSAQLRSAPTATSNPLPTAALPTATTDPAGSPAVYSSVPDRGFMAHPTFAAR